MPDRDIVRRHRVQMWTRRRTPPRVSRRYWTLGSQSRGVRCLEWLTFRPNDRCLLQKSHLAI